MEVIEIDVDAKLGRRRTPVTVPAWLYDRLLSLSELRRAGIPIRLLSMKLIRELKQLRYQGRL